MGLNNAKLNFRNEISKNQTTVVKADWDCLENCYGCIFKLTDVPVESCHEYKEGIQVGPVQWIVIIYNL